MDDIPVTSKNVKVGMIICLPRFPRKPVEVWVLNDKGLILRVEKPVITTLPVSLEKFDTMGYVFVANNKNELGI